MEFYLRMPAGRRKDEMDACANLKSLAFWRRFIWAGFLDEVIRTESILIHRDGWV